MKVTILGSSGSVGAPNNPASGYLVEIPGAPSIVLDLGPGALAKLQELQDPTDAHVLFTHLHPDHCLDFPSLLVWRRFHPEAPAKSRNLCIGPADTERHLGAMDTPGQQESLSDTFAFTPWTAYQPELVDLTTVTPFPTVHPVESYALRLEHEGAVLAYSGDSAPTEELVACARDADVFLCEATWGASSEGKVENMHLSGAEAGQIAQRAGVKRLVLVHIPPWGDPEEALAAARAEFAGEVLLGTSGMQLEL